MPAALTSIETVPFLNMEENSDMGNYQGSMKCNSEAEEGNFDGHNETLSLCDLPVILTKQEVDQPCKEGVQAIEVQEDFDFHSWGGPERELDMCSADEVFFHGQILPLHPSVKSEFSLTSPNTGSRVNNDRSSSTRSQNSSKSTTSSDKSKRIPSSRERNRFHSQPSPKPQIRNCDIRERSAGRQRRRSVSAWELFRLGVVPAPEIELKDLKSRHSVSVSNSSVSRNSSSNSSSNKSFNPNKSNSRNGRTTSSTVANDSNKSNHGFKQILGRNGGFFGGCKCAVETVQQNIAIIKNGTKNSDMIESASTATHALEKDKVLDVKKQKQKIKHAMSHRRTFEWLIGLSHVTYPDEPLLIS